MKLRGWVVGGLALAVLWAFVRGIEPAPEPVADSQVGRVVAGAVGQLLFGLVVGLPTAFVFRRTIPEHVDLSRSLAVAGPLAVYAATFLRELVVATVDVTYRVFAPGPPVDPEVLYVPLRVESDGAVTTIANTITLTPGTLTLDHDPEGNALYVHVIDGRDVDAVVRPIRTWEDNALTIFGEEERAPEQPPQVLVTGDEVADRGELRPVDASTETDDATGPDDGGEERGQ